MPRTPMRSDPGRRPTPDRPTPARPVPDRPVTDRTGPDRTAPDRTVPVIVGLVLATSLAALLAVGVGSVPLAPDRVLAALGTPFGIPGLDASALELKIVWDLRMPRVLLAATVGTGLALAGACLQGLVRNPLADPYVIGVSSGASLGAVIVMIFGSAAIGGFSVAGGAMIGATVLLAAVYGFAQQAGRFTDIRLVLSGVAIGYVAMAVTSFLQLQADPGALRGILFWTMGSVAGARWDSLPIPVIITVLVAGWVLTQARGLNALALGDDDAIALGADLRRLRLGLLLAAAALTATAVSFAGGIGFVGLIVPHAVRLMIGADHRRLLPATAIAGSLFLILVDLAARGLDSPNEYPITIFTAAIGGPFFLFLLRREATS